MTYIADNIPLWSVTIWDKNFTGVDKDWQKKTIKYKYLLSDELDRLNKGGDVRLLYTGKEIGFTTEVLAGDALCEGEIVAIPWGGTPSVKYYKGKFVTGDNRIATSSRPDELLNKYLYYLMKGRLSEIASYYRGAGLKHPAMKDVLRMNISYPAAPEQLKIITQFELLERAIEHRQQQLAVLDELIKARFVEMFGDPFLNPKQHLLLTVKKAVDEGYIDKPIDGNHGEKHPKASEYVEDGIPFVMANNLVNGEIDYANCAKLPKERTDKLDKGFAHDRDVLITHKGTIGRTAIVKTSLEYIMLTPQVTYYRPLRGIIPEYLKGYFDTEFFQEGMKKLAAAGGSTRAYVGITNQSQLPLLIPDLELQRQFAVFVAQVDKSKSVIQKSLDETQLLFDSLMQEYFG